jgi:hypothetical protein
MHYEQQGGWQLDYCYRGRNIIVRGAQYYLDDY